MADTDSRRSAPGALGLPRKLAANAYGGLRRLAVRRWLGGAQRPWLLLRLGPGTRETRPAGWFWSASEAGRQAGPSLLSALRVLDAAGRDHRIGGVLLRFTGPINGWSKALALRRAVADARAAGTRVAAWAESYDAPDYLVASAAERVWLPPSGQLFLVGLRTDHFYLKGLLDRLDVRADVVKVGGYKAAAEGLLREGMSPEQREQTEAWLDDAVAELVAGVAKGRGLPESEVRARIDQGPYPAAAAREAGLVDGCAYPDELDRGLEELGAELEIGPGGDGEPRARLVDAGAYAASGSLDPVWQPLVSHAPRIAYAVAQGTIARSDGRARLGAGIDGEAWRRRLAALAMRPEIAAVVLRIDSPGGDAVASDLLHRAVTRLAASKPVVVSMGDVAASGGYFMAAGAHRIFAEAATLTGSIGVVGGKLDLEGLYRRLGIGRESLERGARAGILSEARAFRPDEREAVRREMEALYATFVARVAEGRGLSEDAVRKLGGGRVWSGRRALGGGLVDRLGGPLEALGEAAERAGFSVDTRFGVEVHPRHPGWLDWRGWLTGGAGARRASSGSV
ncbi:MAG: signal peptide peptidase SppA [Myxococcota bacterium]